MSDYNQAPAPMPTERDMDYVRKVFEHMANSIVDASKVSNEVATLRSEVEAFRKDVQEMRTKNSYLDEELTRARQERDKIKEDFRNVEAENVSLRNTIGDQEENIQHNNDAIISVRNDYTRAIRERDDAQMRNMELEDKLATEQKRWQSFVDMFKPFMSKDVQLPPQADHSTQEPKQETAQADVWPGTRF